MFLHTAQKYSLEGTSRPLILEARIDQEGASKALGGIPYILGLRLTPLRSHPSVSLGLVLLLALRIRLQTDRENR